MATFIAVSVFQALSALFLISTSQNKSRASYYLFFFYFVVAAHMALKFVWLKVLNDPFLFDNLITMFGYSYGLILYLYTKEFFGLTKDKPARLGLHAGIFLIASLIYIFSVGYGIIIHSEEFLVMYRRVIGMFVGIGVTAYCIAAVVLLRKVKKSINFETQPVKARAYRSLALSAWILLVPYLFFMITGFVFSGLINSHSQIPRMVIYGSIVAVVIILIQHHFRDGALPFNEEKEEDATPQYSTSTLSDEQLENYAASLLRAMEQDRLFLDSELKADALAKHLSIGKHHISQVLSLRFGKNFYQFVNAYRIEEFKKRLTASPDSEILELAFECGFKTKSSFNNYFKSFEGSTPTQFRNVLLKSAKTS